MDPQEEARIRAQEKRRAYREANADKLREYKRKWLAENPEKHRQHNRDYATRQRQRAKQRDRERERQRAWREANREHVRETQRKWVEANKERVREIGRESYHRNKERRLEGMRDRDKAQRQDPEKVAKQKAYRKANREHLNELQRQRRARDPEATRRDQRERKQREKRRIELGLPKVPRHRTSKNEQLAHERESAAFFERRRDAKAIRGLEVEGASLAMVASYDRWSARRAAERSANRVLAGYLAHHIAPQRVAELASTVSQREREQIRMDHVARYLRGGPPVDVDGEVRARVTPYVIDELSAQAGVPIFIPAAARKRALTPLSPELRAIQERRNISYPTTVNNGVLPREAAQGAPARQLNERSAERGNEGRSR